MLGVECVWEQCLPAVAGIARRRSLEAGVACCLLLQHAMSCVLCEAGRGCMMVCSLCLLLLLSALHLQQRPCCCTPSGLVLLTPVCEQVYFLSIVAIIMAAGQLVAWLVAE